MLNRFLLLRRAWNLAAAVHFAGELRFLFRLKRYIPSMDNGLDNSHEIANDNGSAVNHGRYTRDAIGHAQFSRDRAMRAAGRGERRALLAGPAAAYPGIRTGHGLGTTGGPITPSAPNSHFGLYVAILVWAVSLAACFETLQTTTQPFARILICTAAGWTSLYLAFCAAKHQRQFLADVGLLSAMAAMSGALYFTMTGFNMQASTGLLLSGAAVIAALFSGILQQRVVLEASCLFTVLWSAHAVRSGDISSTFAVFPAIWALQMYLALRLRAKIPTIMATAAGVMSAAALLFVVAQRGLISTQMALAAMFLVGMVQNRIGSNLRDRGTYSAEIQSNLGWIIAICCAFLMQDTWLQGNLYPWAELTQNQVNSYTMGSAWFVACLAVVGLIAFSGFLRMMGGHQGPLSAALITVLAASIPALITFPEPILKALTGTAANPSLTIGTLIGGGVSGLSIAMIFAGVSKKNSPMLVIGIAALCLQAMFAAEAMRPHSEYHILFALTALVCFLGAILAAHSERGGPAIQDSAARYIEINSPTELPYAAR